MATKAKAAPAAAGGEAAPKGKKTMLIVILAVLIAAAGGGGGAWFFLKNKHADGEEEAPVEKKKKPKLPPVFVNMDPFTLNLADRERYVQLGIVFEAADQPTADAMKTFMPVIRGKVLMLLSSKTAQELMTVEGKQKLAEELIAQAKDPLTLAHAADEINTVHFSSFVIQ